MTICRKLNSTCLTITLCLFLFSFNGNAQFKKLKNLVDKNKTSKVDLDYSTNKYQPTIEFQSLLEHMKLDAQTGIFEPGDLRAYFLPSKDKKGNKVNYSPSSSSAKDMIIQAELFNIEDNKATKISNFYYEAGNIQRVSTQIVVSTRGPASKGFNTEIELKKAGNYELRFYLAGKYFYTFPFNVSVTASDDPYSPVSEIYTLGGPWERYAILQINHNNKGNDYRIRFQPIIDYKGIHVQSNSSVLSNIHEAQLKCSLKYNGKAIGAYSVGENKSDDIFAETDASKFDDYDLYTDKLFSINSGMHFQKIPVPTSGTEHHVQIKNLKDGMYTIDMHIKNMVDRGELKKSYTFQVKNGNIIGASIGNRKTHDDMLTFLETGKDYIIIDSK